MSVVSVAAQGSFQRTTPYLTPDVFKNHARAGVQVENLVPKGTPAQQDYALMMVIEEAAGWVDREAEQTFAAHEQIITGQVNVDRKGFVHLYPPHIPVVGLTSFSIGALPSQMSALTSLSGSYVERNVIHVPVYPLASLTSSQGPIQFGGIGTPWDQAFCTYGYVNGYPVTTLTANITAGALSLPVADTTGIVAGKTWLTVYALTGRFSFLAGAVSNADAGGLGSGPGSVVCTAVPQAISNSSDYPVLVSALPSDLILANVLVTRGLIKAKSGGAVAATSATARSNQHGRKQAGNDFEEAWAIIAKALNPLGGIQ